MSTDLKDKQADTEPDNPSQEHFDRVFNELTSAEHLAKDGIPNDTGSGEQANLPSPGNGVGTEDNPAAAGGTEQTVGGGLGGSGLFTATDGRQQALQAALAIVSRHRKGFFFGGGGIVAVTVGVFVMMGAIDQIALKNIQQVLLQEEAKLEQTAEKDAAKKVFHQLVCRKVRFGVCTPKGSQPNPSDEPPTEEQVAADKSAGKGLATGMDEFNITDPRVVDDMARGGITVATDAQGNFTGLHDDTGADITNEIKTNDARFDQVERALPEWEAGQLRSFRPLMVDHAGVSFDVIKSPGDNIQEDEANAVEKGASAQEYELAQTEEEEKPPPADKNGQTPAGSTEDYQNSQTGSDILDEITQAANDNYKNTKSTSSAIKAAQDAFRSKVAAKGLLATGLATILCTVDRAITKASDARVPAITTLLIRHGSLLLSLTSQSQASPETKGIAMTADQHNELMTSLMGIHNADQESADQQQAAAGKPAPPREEAMAFDRSAAWQRAQNQPVNTDPTSSDWTPDISPAASPTKTGASKIVDKVNSVLGMIGISGNGFICNTLTSKWGILIQAGAGIVQVFATIGSWGASEYLFAGVSQAGIEAIDRVVIPDAVRYFSNISVTGTEDAVQWINNSDAGLDAAFSDYGRRLGGMPQTKAQLSVLNRQADQTIAAARQRQSWVYRTFAVSNPHSLVANLVYKLPLSRQAFFADMMGYITHFPSILINGLANMFRPAVALAAGTSGDMGSLESAAAANNCGDPYCFIKYVPVNDKYDPIDNENYLFSNVSAISAKGKVYSARRIDMLGDPNKYQDSPRGDPNTDDLLHCFVNPYDIPDAAHPYGLGDVSQGTNPNKKHCGSIGTYDYTSDDVTSVPDDTTVAQIYCDYLNKLDTDPSDPIVTCPVPAPHDDVGHFTQYLLDLHIMQDYTSLTTNQ